MIYTTDINEYYKLEIDLGNLMIKETFDRETVALATALNKDGIKNIIKALNYALKDLEDENQ